MRTIMSGRVRSGNSSAPANPQVVEQKISEHKSELEKLERLLFLKKKIDNVKAELSLLVEEHDVIAKALGAVQSGRAKRSTNSEVQACRDDIVAACKQPLAMRDLLDMLSGKYNESTIKCQTRGLLDELALRKVGDRGPNVMYMAADLSPLGKT